MRFGFGFGFDVPRGGGAAAVEPDPSGITGLVVLLAADTGVTSAEDLISAWENQAGADLVQGTEANRPTVGTSPASTIFFDDNWLDFVSPIAHADVMYVYVAVLPVDNVSGFVFDSTPNEAENDLGLRLGAAQPSISGDGGLASYSEPISTSVPSVVRYRINALTGDLGIRVDDGAEEVTNDPSFGLTSWASMGFALGSKVFGLVAVHRAADDLSPEDDAAIVAWLNWQAGI